MLDVPPHYHGWEGKRRARLLARYYGSTLSELVMSVLLEPTTRENVNIQRTALALAAYPRSGIPVGAVLPFGRGERPEAGNLWLGLLWTTALEALSGRPDTSLLEFWRGIEKHPDVFLSQWAVGAYVCMLGPAAEPELERIAATGPGHLPKIATYYLGVLRAQGDSAKVCVNGQASRSAAQRYPESVDSSDAEHFHELMQWYRGKVQ